MSDEYQTEIEQLREGLFRFGQTFNLTNLKFVNYRDPLGNFLTTGLVDEALGKGFDCVEPGTEDPKPWNDKALPHVRKYYPEQLQGYYFSRRDGKALVMHMDAEGREDNLIVRAFARNQYTIHYDEFGDIKEGEARSEIDGATSYVTHQITAESSDFIKEIIFKRKEKINQGQSYLEPIWDVLFAIYMLVSHSAYFIARAGAGLKKGTIAESALEADPGLQQKVLQSMANFGSAADTIWVPKTIEGIEIDFEIITVDNPLRVKEYLDFYLSLISVYTGIPVPVLRGIMQGELTAGEVTEASYFDVLRDMQDLTNEFNKDFVIAINRFHKFAPEDDPFDILYKTRKVISKQDGAALLKTQTENVKALREAGMKTKEAFAFAGLTIKDSDLKDDVDKPIDFRTNEQIDDDADNNDKNDDDDSE